jgi:hypothetical protein
VEFQKYFSPGGLAPSLPEQFFWQFPADRFQNPSKTRGGLPTVGIGLVFSQNFRWLGDAAVLRRRTVPAWPTASVYNRRR